MNSNILHFTFSSTHIKKNEQSQSIFEIKNKFLTDVDTRVTSQGP